MPETRSLRLFSGLEIEPLLQILYPLTDKSLNWEAPPL